MDREEDLEFLGEKLYDVIYPKHADLTPKLTGMLLELPGDVIIQMLQDEALLTKALERALAALQPETSSSRRQSQEKICASDSSDQDEVEMIGEKLFALVRDIEPAHCADITGMLLEMEPDTLRKILSDRTLLEVAVQRAKSARVCLHSHHGKPCDQRV
ncbi:Polyadenylate-binding protein [Bagarius yarrelli]|uniref:Polyadenylate-binding protein n=1 Tax=Bagarius yarrelli TaxID=175774 RepID=A0A556TU43_BAGYA|nr:Polyadenylate-binding protein [Bagarius yarrelli]